VAGIVSTVIPSTPARLSKAMRAWQPQLHGPAAGRGTTASMPAQPDKRASRGWRVSITTVMPMALTSGKKRTNGSQDAASVLHPSRENAVCNAVHDSCRFPLFILDDFTEGVEMLRLDDPGPPIRVVEPVLADPAAAGLMVRAGRARLPGRHLTAHRTTYAIDRVRRAFGV